ncbi:MAG: hypothetical protein ACXU87_24930 [Xanthobacteraceae bacterium]
MSRALAAGWLALALLAGANSHAEPKAQVMTPLLLAVHDAPIPFLGSDGRTHLVYELWITNFSARETVVERVEVVADDKVVATLDGAAVAGRLQPAGRGEASATMAPSTQALLFVHVVAGRMRRSRGSSRTASARGSRPRRRAGRRCAKAAARRRSRSATWW